MARRKSKGKRALRCKVISVCGKRRRVCWGKRGIVSNKRA